MTQNIGMLAPAVVVGSKGRDRIVPPACQPTDLETPVFDDSQTTGELEPNARTSPVVNPAETEISLVVIQGYVSRQKTEELQVAVTRTCDRLNNLMNGRGPQYASYHLQELLVDDKPVGERKREYPSDRYWEVLSANKAEFQTDLVIGVCAHQLSESSFTLDDREHGLAMVTASDYSLYAPPGLTIERYLMYLITSVSLILQYPAIQEHRPAAGCLFDEYNPTSQITVGLRRPSLEHCRSSQLKGLSDQALAPYVAVLDDIRHRDGLALLGSRAGARGAAFLLGILTAFWTSLLVAESPRGALVATWVGLVAFAVLLSVRQITRRLWVQNHRRLAFATLAVVTVCAVAGGAFLVAVRQLPHLRSDSRASCISAAHGLTKRQTTTATSVQIVVAC